MSIQSDVIFQVADHFGDKLIVSALGPAGQVGVRRIEFLIGEETVLAGPDAVARLRDALTVWLDDASATGEAPTP